MKYILPLVIALFLGSVPAWAQQGGLPVTQAQVNELQSQIDFLQGSLLALQKQVDNLSSLIQPDDGTARDLAGTWIGPGTSLEFESAGVQLFFTQNGILSPFVTVPRGDGSFDQYGVNPQVLVPRNGSPNTITFRLDRDLNLRMHLTGTATSTDQPSQQITLRGVALSNGFFLLRAFAGGMGSCAPTIYQAVGALNLDRNVMTVIGSGVDTNCQHSVFRLQLRKQ